jgi:hypothetical protein
MSLSSGLETKRDAPRLTCTDSPGNLQIATSKSRHVISVPFLSSSLYTLTASSSLSLSLRYTISSASAAPYLSFGSQPLGDWIVEVVFAAGVEIGRKEVSGVSRVLRPMTRLSLVSSFGAGEAEGFLVAPYKVLFTNPSARISSHAVSFTGSIGALRGCASFPNSW